MPRSRNIKPGLYKNDELANCSIWARFLFPGLWMLADREGRLEDRPKRIKAELLPFDPNDVDPLLDELESLGFLQRYVNSDGRFIQINNFLKHQNPHRTETKSGIAPPTDTPMPRVLASTPVVAASSPDIAASTPNVARLIPDSLVLIPDSLIPDSSVLIPDSLLLIPESNQAKSRSKPRPSVAASDCQKLPDWIPAKAWGKFVEGRKKLKPPMTEHAAVLIVAELGKFRAAGENVEAVINQSIVNGWKGVFPLKRNGRAGSVSDHNREVGERFVQKRDQEPSE